MIIVSNEESESEHLNELGLHEEALQAVQRELTIRQDRDTYWDAVSSALAVKNYPLAAEYADRLRSFSGTWKKDLQLVSHAYNFAGRADDAYQCCREALAIKEPNDAEDYYTMACRASSIDRQNEALENILQALSHIRAENEKYLIRKAFLDSELAAVWEHSENIAPDLPFALAVYFPTWKSVLMQNGPREPERMVDHSDLRYIPKQFLPLLKNISSCTFETSPLEIAKDPELHRSYLDWQEMVVAQRLAPFHRFMDHVERVLIENQASFARFQAERQRYGAARSHLIQILKHSPDCDPARLPDIPLIDPILKEFQAQFQESPESFARLVNSGRVGLSPEKAAELPLVNRNSALAALRVARRHQLLRQHNQAIQALSACAKIWPWDEVLLIDLARSFSEAGHAQKALDALDAIPPQVLPDDLRNQLEQNINFKDWERISLSKPPEIPLPNFRGFYPGANQEFLQWLEESENSIRSLAP